MSRSRTDETGTTRQGTAVPRGSRSAGHPDPETLRRFMAGSLDAVATRQVVVHLLGNCETCRRVTAGAPGSPFVQSGGGDEPAAPPAAAGASELLRRLRAREQEMSREETQATALLAELEPLPQARRVLLVRNSARFRTWGLVERLLQESYASRFDDPTRTLDLADLAVVIAEGLGDEHGVELRNDLLARAWALRGNACRIKSDLAGAERSFERASALLGDGTGDPLEEARVYELAAFLRSDQRRFDDAIRLQERAFRLYRRAGDVSKVGKSLFDQATFCGRAGDRERAIFLSRQALDHLDRERDTHLVLAASHNLVVYLQEEGRLREALELLGEAKSLYREQGDRMNLLRLVWLEGRLARELGDVAAAEESLRRAARGFIEADVPLDAAMVALEVAGLLLEEGRAAEVRGLAARIQQVFASLGVAREAMAAWLLFLEAVEEDAVTRSLIDRVTSRLESQVAAGRKRLV